MRIETLARGGLAGFVGLVAVEHPLRTDLPPHAHFISEYASGSTEVVAAAAFVAWGVGIGATAVLAWRGGLRAVPVLLGVATAGAAMCAVWDTQTVAGELPAGVARTTAGRLHDQGTLLLFVGLLGAAVWALRALPTRRYRLGLASCAAGLVLAPGVLVATGRDWPGIGQRAIVLVGVAAGWLLIGELATRGPRTPARARG